MIVSMRNERIEGTYVFSSTRPLSCFLLDPKPNIWFCYDHQIWINHGPTRKVDFSLFLCFVLSCAKPSLHSGFGLSFIYELSNVKNLLGEYIVE